MPRFLPVVWLGSTLTPIPSTSWNRQMCYTERKMTKRVREGGEQLSHEWAGAKYINRSQTHECGNLDWGRAIPFLEIFVSNFQFCVFAVWTRLSPVLGVAQWWMSCGWDLAERGWNIAELWIRSIAESMCMRSIVESTSDYQRKLCNSLGFNLSILESEEWQMKQCWIKYFKKSKNPFLTISAIGFIGSAPRIQSSQKLM